MRYLTLKEALELHELVIGQSGGSAGTRDFGALESALAQPLMTFGGEDLYPTLAEKAAAVAFSVVKNHPFLDGNKRTAHALMETFLILNGFELSAGVDEQESVMLEVASGVRDRKTFVTWVNDHIVKQD